MGAAANAGQARRTAEPSRTEPSASRTARRPPGPRWIEATGAPVRMLPAGIRLASASIRRLIPPRSATKAPGRAEEGAWFEVGAPPSPPRMLPWRRSRSRKRGIVARRLRRSASAVKIEATIGSAARSSASRPNLRRTNEARLSSSTLSGRGRTSGSSAIRTFPGHENSDERKTGPIRVGAIITNPSGTRWSLPFQRISVPP